MRKQMIFDVFYDTIVVGGGAAGMLAAGFAAKLGGKVLLIEKNPIMGKKLKITGKGRCNVTNMCSDDEFFFNITRNKKFIFSAFSKFKPDDVVSFFENLGVALKTERGNRVFPESDSAGDIVYALKRFAAMSGVQFLNGTPVIQILAERGAVSGVKTSAQAYRCRNVILASGGLSYPGTGSNGDGYRMARELGHNITELLPSLVPLEAKQDICAEMQGLSLKNIGFKVYSGNNKLLFEDFGELLFTHFGITGPVVLSASAHLRDYTSDYYCIIDLKPALDEKKLDARILRDFSEFKNRDFQNSLGKLLHRTMIPVIISLSGIPSDTKTHSVTREQRASLIKIIKGLRIDIIGPRPIDEAVITSGGVNVAEINPATMESKIIKGLYFAGEIIDIDAYTGGFNLQIAWSTAFAAGNSVQ